MKKEFNIEPGQKWKSELFDSEFTIEKIENGYVYAYDRDNYIRRKIDEFEEIFSYVEPEPAFSGLTGLSGVINFTSMDLSGFSAKTGIIRMSNGEIYIPDLYEEIKERIEKVKRSFPELYLIVFYFYSKEDFSLRVIDEENFIRLLNNGEYGNDPDIIIDISDAKEGSLMIFKGLKNPIIPKAKAIQKTDWEL